MITISPKHRVFLSIQPIDFRKGIQGISSLCKNKFRQDPMKGHYFIFRNKRKSDIKMLFYDAQGFCLLQKTASAGKFQWPTAATDLITLTPTQLHVLLQMGDPRSVKTLGEWKPIRED